MLKVLIADDEKKVCRLITMLCDWDALGMELAGIAYDGPEALSLIEELKPDILITDIRMPGCDGIEVIRQARDRQMSLEILVISGHSDFKYAQSAIHYHVSDYLLKPIKKEELNRTLAGMAERCRKEKDRLSVSRQLMEYMESDLARNRSRLFYDYLFASPRREIPDAALLNREYGYQFQDGYYRILILKLDYNIEQFDNRSIDPILDDLKNLIRENLSLLCYDSEAVTDDSRCFFLCNYNTENRSAFRRAARRAADKIDQSRFHFWKAEFSIGLGDRVTRPEDLYLSLDSAENALNERLLAGCGRLLSPPETAGIWENTEFLDRFYRHLHRAVEIHDAELASAAVRRLRTGILSGEGVTGTAVRNDVRSAGLHAITLFPAEGPDRRTDFLRQCDFCSSADQLFAVLDRTVSGLIAENRARMAEENRRPVRAAQEYIQAHYLEQISLDDAASVAGFSSSYFSSLFKKETGQNFADYLTELRMEKAKELLKNTRISVREICQQVGYRDLKHFNTVFQKNTGLKPGTFRKLYS